MHSLFNFAIKPEQGLRIEWPFTPTYPYHNFDCNCRKYNESLFTVLAGNLTQCETLRKADLKEVSEGLQDANPVQCEVDGSYSQVQCNGFTNVCWCVDENGVMVEGTETRERQPDCSPSKSFCNFPDEFKLYLQSTLWFLVARGSEASHIVAWGGKVLCGLCGVGGWLRYPSLSVGKNACLLGQS